MNDTTCTDGKRHKWVVIHCGYYEVNKRHEDIWCEKCGAISERMDGTRCKNYDGSYYTKFPKNLGLPDSVDPEENECAEIGEDCDYE